MNLSLQEDSKKVKLSANDLFDRIINLKIKVGIPATKTNPAVIKDEFVIRSDFEVFYTNSDSIFYRGENTGDYIIRRCTMKPSIKVHCNMVTANVGTAIDVYIANFFIFTSEGTYLRNFTMKDYAVLEVEIVMGYWGQFANTLNEDSSIKDFFNLKAQNGADRIVIGNPVIVSTDKLPPDSVIHLHGYVADVLSSPLAIEQVKDYETAVKKPTFKSGDKLDDLFFNVITRRYLKHNSINESASDISVDEDKPKRKPKVDETTGMMSEEDAKKYGVQVYISEEAKKFVYEDKTDGEGKTVSASTYFESGWTIGKTITRVLSFINPRLNYRFTNKGDILIFTNEEENDINTLNKSFKKIVQENVFAKYYDSKLPAVYNINLGAVTSISCPYYAFIEPFQTIEFASRYSLSGLIEYVVGYPASKNQFIAIRASISFATVEPLNEVTISAIIKKAD